MTAATIQASFDQALEVTGEGPRPLFRDLPPPSDFPIEALGPILSDAASAIEGVIQCPMVCAANSVLAVASLAAQGRANVILPIGQGKPAPLSLFLLTVLESGERKSSADTMALKPVRFFEKEVSELEAGARGSHAAKLTAYEANAKHLTNKLKADVRALEAALNELGSPPAAPLVSVIAPSGDQTMEGLFRIYQHGRPSLAMLCDDAATFLGGHSLRTEQKAGTTANLCRAWDGAKLERIRGGDGVMVLYDRRLASHFMVQPGVASDFLSDSQFADQGLLARFLIAAPLGRAGTRFRDDVAYRTLAAQAAKKLDGYNEAVLRLLREPIRWKNELDRTFGVEMNELTLSPAARALFVQFANEIEKEMGPKGAINSTRAFASKLPENAARIAGTLTLLADPNADTINERVLADAMQLADFYLSEANRLLASGAIDPALRQAELVRVWLLDQSEEIIPLQAIYQRGPNSIRQAEKAREAMKVLEEHGWVKKLDEGTVIDGKHCRTVWRVIKC